MNKEGKQREKDMAQLGSRARGGAVLSALFRAIGNESTELISVKVPGSKDGKMRTCLVSKVEAIVRDTFEKAIPKNRVDGEVPIDPKVQLDCRKLIFDRMAGKPGMDEKGSDAADVPTRVSRLNKSRLNEFATKTEGDEGATTKNTAKKTRIPKIPVCLPKQV